MQNIEFDTISQVVIHAENFKWIQKNTEMLLLSLEYWFQKDLARFDLAEYNSYKREIIAFVDKKCYKFNNLKDIEGFFNQYTGNYIHFVFRLTKCTQSA